MDRQEKFDACMKFFESLSDILKETHTMIGSCNHDSSVYLVPNGTEESISYYGKPKNSFRVSDHWNWYANTKKCENEHYIQCLSVDMPRPNERPLPWKASKPKYGSQVAIVGKDGKYRCVYGEKFDRKKRQWTWVESDPFEVAKMVMGL